MKKSWLIELIFWLHLPIVIIWFGTFLIPLSVFPGRITFHFWFMAIVLLSQIVWGMMLYPKTKSFEMICPLTTPMQYLRGYEIKDKRNYNHSFIAELLDRFNIKMSFNAVNILLWVTFAIVIIQYLS